MIYYVVHPGSVTLQNGTTVFIDAGTLASLYGLVFGEYATGIVESQDNGQHIHLYPRADSKYRNIKTEVGDVPDGTLFYSISAQALRRRRRRGME
jgi:hypothetical protein